MPSTKESPSCRVRRLEAPSSASSTLAQPLAIDLDPLAPHQRQAVRAREERATSARVERLAVERRRRPRSRAARRRPRRPRLAARRVDLHLGPRRRACPSTSRARARRRRPPRTRDVRREIGAPPPASRPSGWIDGAARPPARAATALVRGRPLHRLEQRRAARPCCARPRTRGAPRPAEGAGPWPRRQPRRVGREERERRLRVSLVLGEVEAHASQRLHSGFLPAGTSRRYRRMRRAPPGRRGHPRPRSLRGRRRQVLAPVERRRGGGQRRQLLARVRHFDPGARRLRIRRRAQSRDEQAADLAQPRGRGRNHGIDFDRSEVQDAWAVTRRERRRMRAAAFGSEASVASSVATSK